MKDAAITFRVPRRTRQQIEELARREGRSLSQQVERLIEAALQMPRPPAVSPPPASAPRRARSISGSLQGARVPTLADFRKVRQRLSASLAGRLADRGQLRR